MNNRERELSQTIAELEARLIKAHREHGALEYEGKLELIRIRARTHAQLERLMYRWRNVGDDDSRLATFQQCARELDSAMTAILDPK